MTRVVFNDAALTQLLTGEEGPVARDLLRRAINVEGQAKINATGRPGPMVQTGRLRSSITHELSRGPAGLAARVGTNVTYAAYVELGTAPHRISARNKKALNWKGAAHPVRAVNHPGNRPYPFLRPALAAAAL